MSLGDKAEQRTYKFFG